MTSYPGSGTFCPDLAILVPVLFGLCCMALVLAGQVGKVMAERYRQGENWGWEAVAVTVQTAVGFSAGLAGWLIVLASW
jgi:hypothetical protein